MLENEGVMMERPQYIHWLIKEDGVVFEDQQPLNCYNLSYEMDDISLDNWALHIRRHYMMSISCYRELHAISSLMISEVQKFYAPSSLRE